MALLTDDEVRQRLAGLPDWTRQGDSITNERKLAGFSPAMLYAVAVGHLAEAANHHPDILIQWNKVTLTLSTHSEGGLTEADFELAGKISALG
jgi:4a-hydroxytetrahydrobiopterin dehydratase